MFRGTHSVKLDIKGRLAIPARQRERLCEVGEGRLVITAAPSRCLLVYPETSFRELERKLAAMPDFSGAAESLKRVLIGYANDVEPDAQGRVPLTPPQRNYAKLDKDVVLVGQINRFELWDEAAWQQELDRSASLTTEMLAADPNTAGFRL